MQCKNHPIVEAEGRCCGCQDAFCSNCLVEIGGKNYCASCKIMAVTEPLPPRNLETIPCPEARDALVISIIGIFIFGFILGPIAACKGFSARKLIINNPELSGEGKATAAIIIGVVATIFSVIGLYVKLSAAMKNVS